MSDTVIKVEHLGKKYLIRHQQSERYVALRDVLTNKFKSFGRRLISLQPDSSKLQPSREEFWALKDVSFEVKQGDRVGIIGRNGAGKTTLLKLLSRITEPTSGRIAIKGRVASLLEVGTGFHPELTGRENIYLNGAILGMSKAEIKKKFDEIVDFAEIERFLDTPVKRYSSGMYVRLAFAVAAHLEPEILLVDEVLAVGDAAFQKKCLGKMEDVSTQEGRTVLFVSHNMSAVRSLCKDALILEGGLISYVGSSSDVIERYVTGAQKAFSPSTDISKFPRIKGSDIVRIVEVSISNISGYPTTSFSVWEPFIVVLSFVCRDLNKAASFWILIGSPDGATVLSTFQYDYLEPLRLDKNIGTARVYIDPNILSPGSYFLSVGAFGKQNEFYDWVEQASRFEIRGEFSSGKKWDQRLGITTLNYRWKIN
jgi:lipopolysaccharide transport system ATP-binding protein